MCNNRGNQQIFTKPRASLAYTRNQDDARRVSREHRDVVTSTNKYPETNTGLGLAPSSPASFGILI